ncbi:MAG: hypothetical protein M3O62_12485 [Pseudomonadota bacterium]|nr:hypothetical protein [Pseudomonadota bacterium]
MAFGFACRRRDEIEATSVGSASLPESDPLARFVHVDPEEDDDDTDRQELHDIGCTCHLRGI